MMNDKIKAGGCAIVTKYLAATDRKGSRIVVSLPEGGPEHKALTVPYNVAETAAQNASVTGDVLTGQIHAAAVGMFLESIRSTGFTWCDHGWIGASVKTGYVFVPTPAIATLYRVELFPLLGANHSEYVLGTYDQARDYGNKLARDYGARSALATRIKDLPVSEWGDLKLKDIRFITFDTLTDSRGIV